MIADVTDLITPSDLTFARLLFQSGYRVEAIAVRVAHQPRALESTARRHAWRRRTPCRADAILGARVPVTARCSECLARFGEVWGDPRACPRCGSVLRGAPAQGERSWCQP